MWRESVTELADRIVAHPAFSEAAQSYICEYIDWRMSLGTLNKVIANAGRLRVLENLCLLHFLSLEAGGQGTSFERLVEMSGVTDEIGARAVRTLLRLAQIAGLVVTGRGADDGRLRVYRPTDALLAHANDQIVLHLKPLDVFFPDLGLAARLEDPQRFFHSVAMGFGRVYLEQSLRRPGMDLAYRDLMRLDGAMPIFCVVIDCHRRGRDLPAAAELSRRFLVSQSQVRALLKRAESEGLLRLGPRGRILEATKLVDAMFAAYARFLAFTAFHVFEVERISPA